MLDRIFLQTDPFGVMQQLQELLATRPEDAPSLIISFIVPIVIMAGILFLVFTFYRWHKQSKEYAGPGRRLGKFRITIQAQKTLIGNVNKYELPLQPEDKEAVKKISYMEEAVKYIEGLIKQRQMFVYQMRQTEISDIRKKESGVTNDILLISSAPIEDESNSWEDQRGEFSWSSLATVYPRNVLSFVTTRYHKILTPDRNLKEVYVLSPIPLLGKGEKMPFGFSEAEFLQKQHQIEVIVLESSESLAKAVLYLEAVVLAESKINARDAQIDKLMESMEIKDNKLLEKGLREDRYRLRIGEKMLVGEFERRPEEERGEPWGWHIMFAISTIAGYMIFPEIVITMPPFIGAMLAFAIMVGIRFLSLRTKRKQQKLEENVSTI